MQTNIIANRLDALLCHNVASTCYLTGFQSIIGAGKYSATLVLRDGDPILIAQDFEMYNAQISCWLDDEKKFAYKLFEDPIDLTRHLLLEKGLERGRVGIETGQSCLTHDEFESLTRAMPEAQFDNATSIVANVRAIKSPEEINYIRNAAIISSGAMEAVMQLAGEGKTDNDLAAAAMEYCVRHGGEFFCIEPIISLGARSGVPHCTFTRNRVKNGDLCFVEIGACIQRYSGPIIRSFSVGEPGDFERRVCDEIQASLEAVIENLRPGIRARDVALRSRAPWEWTFTHQELFWNGAYAYSIGLGFPPNWGDSPILVREQDQTILKPGMVFHCTNNVRKGGVFGVGISETVVITETGCEVLTCCPRHLYIV